MPDTIYTFGINAKRGLVTYFKPFSENVAHNLVL